MSKPNMAYRIVAKPNPMTGQLHYLPMVVHTGTKVSLEDVAKEAIDRGLMPGIKPTAAESIGRGFGEEIYRQCQLGKGVSFDDYFYTGIYLDGTVDGPSGALTDANHVNVRLYKGKKFALKRDAFSWHNIAATGQPEVTTFASPGAYDNGEVARGATLFIMGDNLVSAAGADAASYRLSWPGEDNDPVSVPLTPTAAKAGQVTFAAVSTLDTAAIGTQLTLTVTVYTAEGTMLQATATATLVAAVG